MFVFVERTLKLINGRNRVLMDETTIDDMKIAEDRTFGIDTGYANEEKMSRASLQMKNMKGISSDERLRPLIEGNRCIARVVEHVMLEDTNEYFYQWPSALKNEKQDRCLTHSRNWIQPVEREHKGVKARRARKRLSLLGCGKGSDGESLQLSISVCQRHRFLRSVAKGSCWTEDLRSVHDETFVFFRARASFVLTFIQLAKQSLSSKLTIISYLSSCRIVLDRLRSSVHWWHWEVSNERQWRCDSTHSRAHVRLYRARFPMFGW